MRRLRECGFTNKELSILVRGKISEASIKRNTRGAEVRDTREHDQIIEALGDFADRGYEVRDIESYKEYARARIARTSTSTMNSGRRVSALRCRCISETQQRSMVTQPRYSGE